VPLSSYCVYSAGLVLETLLVFRLCTTGLWRRYGFVLACTLYVLIFQTILSFLIFQYAPRLYAQYYWDTETLNMALRFLIVWELFRHTFPAGSPLRRMVSTGLAMSTLIVMAFWGLETYGKFHSLPLAVERSFGFAQAVLVMAILFTARYYQVPLGRNVWGVAVAFGMQSSLYTANAALIDILHAFLPYWRFFGPLTFVAMMGMWTWALWIYAPNPAIPVEASINQEDALEQWSREWGRTVSVARKAMNP